MQKIYFEGPSHCQASWIDIKAKELCVALPLILIIFWVGIYPNPLLKQIQNVTKGPQLVAQIEESHD